MTIIEAINKADSLNPNTYTQADKVAWLDRVDQTVKRLALDTHETDIVFTGYDTDTPVDTALLIYAPYDEAYVHYIFSQIHLHNSEYDKYNNFAALYNRALQTFLDDYNRNHKPKSWGQFLF